MGFESSPGYLLSFILLTTVQNKIQHLDAEKSDSVELMIMC